ncbi:DUF1109 domain-containing protein [Pseudoxanthomonas sp.]|jgi:hypothetical protein|uniref:DUF1109 domain-containing protein n=1 Tax=Pseudoxanthomonas sp. TaxID=1871049 RepID=UPI002E1239EC|nr:DUF1109 domain-containing protein [Pseudoxanthomonas sp.]
MTDTRRLIDQLAARAEPVRPLSSPLRRTALWVVLAAVLIAMIASVYGLRTGLLADLAQAPLLLEWIASVLTGLLAAYAVFQISVPGRSPRWMWLPVPALLLWLGGLGWGCLRDYARLGADAFLMEAVSSECAVAITMTSVPLGLLMLVMVRHAGVVRPAPTAMLVALSAAALSAAGVSLYHGGETALMVLLWHLGAVVVLSLLCLLFGRPLFAWIGYAKR